jgi:REP element-mobilizing transposase RayT
MPQSYTSLIYHIVFGTKHCVPHIDKHLAPRLHAYMAGIIKNLRGLPICIGGVADHVHVLTILSQDYAVKDVLRDLKANSSRWVHQEYREAFDFKWQDGYSAFTVGIRGVPQVKAYINKQAEHHREVPFVEELKDFLETHGIPFDERYLK